MAPVSPFHHYCDIGDCLAPFGYGTLSRKLNSLTIRYRAVDGYMYGASIRNECKQRSKQEDNIGVFARPVLGISLP